MVTVLPNVTVPWVLAVLPRDAVNVPTGADGFTMILNCLSACCPLLPVARTVNVYVPGMAVWFTAADINPELLILNPEGSEPV